MAPWGVLLWMRSTTGQVPPAPRPAATLRSTSPSPTEITPLHRGPWGELEYSRILIEPPEEFITANYTKPEAIHWVFKNYSESSLATLWENAGLTATQRAFLAAPSHRQVTSEAIIILPGRDFIIGLSPESRGKIYTSLAEFPENSAQYEPYRLRNDAVPQWFDDSGLSAETIALTKRMLYHRANSAFFSDDEIILPMLSASTERIKYIKTLSRKSALIVQLRVRPNTDIENIARYWGRGRRSKDLRPLLQSLARRPDGGMIDIVHLLPPFARSMLYTYPLPSENPTDASHDCHWSSFNFLKSTPDERFANIEFVKQTLLNDYYPVPGEPKLGDLLVMVTPTGVVVHSCVYIADNIVFTKNGPGFSVPWMLAPLDDVVAFYSIGPRLEVRHYRAKND